MYHHSVNHGAPSHPPTVYPAVSQPFKIAATVLGGIFLGTSGIVLIFSDEFTRPIEQFLGVAACLLLLVMIPLSVRYIRVRKPSLVIDRDGIELPIEGRIHWREIHSIQLRPFQRSHMLEVKLHKPSEIVNRIPASARVLALVARWMGWGPIAISPMSIRLALNERRPSDVELLEGVAWEMRRHNPSLARTY
ncbi:STM3941 family protein [Nocardia sp. NPDC003693]